LLSFRLIPSDQIRTHLPGVYLAMSANSLGHYRCGPALRSLPFLSVIVPVHNGERTLRDVLEALCNQAYEKAKMEIIVVDDFSNDGSAAMAREFPVLLLRNEANLGLSASLNRGIRLARGSLIITLHQDCVPLSPDWAGDIAGHFASAHETGSISSFLVLQDKLSFLDTIFVHIYIQGWSRDFDRSRLPGRDGLVEVNFVGDKCDAFDRTALEKVGNFDEKFISSNEDLVLSHMLRERKFKMFLDKDLTVQHRLVSLNLMSHLHQALRRARPQAIVMHELGYFAGSEIIIPFALIMWSLMFLVLRIAFRVGAANLFLGLASVFASICSAIYMSSKKMPPFYTFSHSERFRSLVKNLTVLSLSGSFLLFMAKLGFSADLLLLAPATVGISLLVVRAGLRVMRSARYRFRQVGLWVALSIVIPAFVLSLLFDSLYALGFLEGMILFHALRRKRL